MRRGRRRVFSLQAKSFVVAAVLLGVLVVAWVYLRDREGVVRGIQASVPQIEEVQEDGYAYGYTAATFGVLMGEQEDKPVVKVTQGLRELAITVESPIHSGAVSASPSPSPVVDLLDENPVADEAVDSSSDPVVSDFSEETVASSPSPSVVPEAAASPEPSSLPVSSVEPVSTDTDDVIAPDAVLDEETPVEPSDAAVDDSVPAIEPAIDTVLEEPLSFLRHFIGFSAHAQQQLEVVHPDTEPAVVYQDSGFTLTPTLDKVSLDFVVPSIDGFPAFRIEPEQLTAAGSGAEVVFQTRTNRQAFTFANAVLIDANGAQHLVTLQVTSHLEGNPLYEHRYWYEVAVVPGSLEDAEPLVYPATLTLDLVSLFHDRMLPVRPVKQDFLATEDLAFTVDVAAIDDETLRAALSDDAFPEVRFGLIDSVGRMKELSSVTSQQLPDGQVQISLSPEGQVLEPGLFDLLIQRGSDNAYISEQDFSWGVLAVNPDQAVYRSGQDAQLAMAVLDSRGRMVCTADVTARITSPTGEETLLSTSAGTVQITEGCTERITDLPDYVATYQTGSEGEYALELTAVTRDGSFTVMDSFLVDDSAPVYVRRLGPSRIYPLADYTMALEVTAQQDVSRIEDLVPWDFELVASGGAEVVGASGVSGARRLVWERAFAAGETATVQYTFDAPDISPTLFLLGPATVVGPGFADGYTEPRRWQIASDTTEFVTDTLQASYTIPTAWNDSDNFIEVIGGGGGGITGSNGTGSGGASGGGGGGGGAYSKITDQTYTPDSSVTIQVGDGGGADTAGEDTFFDRTAGSNGDCTDTVALCAKGGGVGSGTTQGTGGQLGSGVGTTKVSGGNGGNGGTSSHNTGAGGGGGGGAGGCGASTCAKASAGGTGNNASNGNNSVNNGNPGTGGAGGQGDSTFGGSAGGASSGNGGNGAEWDSTPYGSGGGSGGGDGGTNGGNGVAGGTAGNYGAGGGGGGGGGKNGNGAAGASGSDGIIVVSYTPTSSDPVTEDLLRHGNYFQNEAEQSFFWAQ